MGESYGVKLRVLVTLDLKVEEGVSVSEIKESERFTEKSTESK